VNVSPHPARIIWREHHCQEELEMASMEARERVADPAHGAGTQVGGQTSRRYEYEMLGLLLGILGTLLVLAVTVGAAPRF
jgi:hypothetical protein